VMNTNNGDQGPANAELLLDRLSKAPPHDRLRRDSGRGRSAAGSRRPNDASGNDGAEPAYLAYCDTLEGRGTNIATARGLSRTPLMTGTAQGVKQ
jgi:hypothetical protein